MRSAWIAITGVAVLIFGLTTLKPSVGATIVLVLYLLLTAAAAASTEERENGRH